MMFLKILFIFACLVGVVWVIKARMDESQKTRRRTETVGEKEKKPEPKKENETSTHSSVSGNGDHGHGHGPKKKTPWWLQLPLFIILVALALWGASWLWHHLPAEVKAAPRVRDQSVEARVTTPQTVLTGIRCKGETSVISVIRPGESIVVWMPTGGEVETFPSDPDLVIESLDNPSLSTRGGGHLDASSNFFSVRNTRAEGGSSFNFACEYK